MRNFTEEWKCKNPVKGTAAASADKFYFLTGTEQEAAVHRPGCPAVVCCPWSQSVKVKAAVKLPDAASSSRLPAYIQDFIYWLSRSSQAQTLPRSYLEYFLGKDFNHQINEGGKGEVSVSQHQHWLLHVKVGVSVKLHYAWHVSDQLS